MPKSSPSTTAADVAQWMLEEIDRVRYLDQEDAVYKIERQFGSEFVYANDAGNPAISKKVLAAFNKLTKETVVWDRSERHWRRRSPYDAPGRMQE